MTINQSKWQPEMSLRLTLLQAQGNSASQIAQALNREFHMGFTRNAVIGKISRLGLQGQRPARTLTQKRSEASTANGAVRRINRRRPAPLDVAEELLADGVTDLPPDQSEFAVSFMERRPEQCCWPLGDPRSASFMVCGDGKMSESSYCARHHWIAYHRPVKLTHEQRADKARQARINMRGAA